jgi:hypothetical protein
VDQDRRKLLANSLQRGFEPTARVDLVRLPCAESHLTAGWLVHARLVLPDKMRQVARACVVEVETLAGGALPIGDRAAALQKLKLRLVPRPSELAWPLLLNGDGRL